MGVIVRMQRRPVKTKFDYVEQVNGRKVTTKKSTGKVVVFGGFAYRKKTRNDAE